MIVLLGFAAGQTFGITEFDPSRAIAVAVDATLVRCLLMSPTMSLSGRANRWATAAQPGRPAAVGRPGWAGPGENPLAGEP